MFLPLALLSLLVELAAGYPDRVVKAVGHPVIWIGKLIEFLDRTLNVATETAQQRRMSGIGALVLLLLAVAFIGHAAELLLGWFAFGIVPTAILASTLLAQRSLAGHVKAVADGLDAGGLAEGRRAVSMIVGRDPDRLDEGGISRAAIESLAENFSDGVVAPAFWLAVGGVTAAAVYKATNTADSMIGHRTPRHEAFGWAAARFDDLVNLPASRLTALLLIVAAALLPGCDASGAWRAVRRDASRHRSPNAGWPEAAMAGALGLAIAGPRFYGGVEVQDATMGEGGRREATAADIRAALRLYWAADGLMIGLLALLSALVWFW